MYVTIYIYIYIYTCMYMSEATNVRKKSYELVIYVARTQEAYGQLSYMPSHIAP